MPRGLRVLHLEDDAVDAELVAEVLRADGLMAQISASTPGRPGRRP